ncbi:MAG: hypothetical protein AAGA35_02785 [Patescibacteria group bacterium]
MPRSRELKKVSDLFDKYKQILIPPQKTVEKAFTEVVEEVLEITIDQKLVSYTPSTNTIGLTVPSVIKQEIKLHQQEVLTHVVGRLGDRYKNLSIL